MMQRRFRTRYLAAVLAAVVCVSTWVPSALASVAYNGTRGLIRTRSADTFHKGTLSFQIPAPTLTSTGCTAPPL